MNEEELLQRIRALQIERGRDFEQVLKYLRKDLSHMATRLGARQWAMYADAEQTFDSCMRLLDPENPAHVPTLEAAFTAHDRCSVFIRAWDKAHASQGA